MTNDGLFLDGFLIIFVNIKDVILVIFSVYSIGVRTHRLIDL